MVKFADAGTIRREATCLTDAEAVLRALHDSTAPKLVGQDVQLFKAILSDLFPSMSLADQVCAPTYILQYK